MRDLRQCAAQPPRFRPRLIPAPAVLGGIKFQPEAGIAEEFEIAMNRLSADTALDRQRRRVDGRAGAEPGHHDGEAQETISAGGLHKFSRGRW